MSPGRKAIYPELLARVAKQFEAELQRFLPSPHPARFGAYHLLSGFTTERPGKVSVVLQCAQGAIADRAMGIDFEQEAQSFRGHVPAPLLGEAQEETLIAGEAIDLLVVRAITVQFMQRHQGDADASVVGRVLA